MSHTPSNLTICGSGNAGHALAVVASANFGGDIDWLVGSTQRAELLREAMTPGGLHSTGAITASVNRIRTISPDPAAVIPDAGMVLIVVPAFAHAGVLRRISPYLGANTAVGCIPTRGGFEFESAHLTPEILGKRPTIFGLQTLPWSTRITSVGKVVNIGAVKEEVVLAALPASEAPHLASALSTILATRVVTTDAFVGLTLANPGQFIHPGLMYGHFRSWQGEEYDTDAIPMLYAEATDEMGDLVERLSRESIAVADAIESQSASLLKPRHVLPVHDWLVKVYGHVTGDTSTVGSCFRTGPIRGRRAPTLELSPGKFIPNFGYRYLSEDIPFGLVTTRALAEIVHVATPVIDEVITWAQSVLQKGYLMGDSLVGPDARKLPLPQNQGVSSSSDLVAWYHDHGAWGVAADRPASARW
jgi:predicted dinucleotide-binding enzyme